MSQDIAPFCSTCGKPLDVHMGLLATCARLATALKVLKEIAALEKSYRASKMAADAIEFIEHNHPK